MPPIVRDPAKWMRRPDAAIILPHVRMSRLPRGSHGHVRIATWEPQDFVREVQSAKSDCMVPSCCASSSTRLHSGWPRKVVPGISFTGDWALLFGVALVFGALNVAVRPILLTPDASVPAGHARVLPARIECRDAATDERGVGRVGVGLSRRGVLVSVPRGARRQRRELRADAIRGV